MLNENFAKNSEESEDRNQNKENVCHSKGYF